MERLIVPILKHGGLIREISATEETRTYENDRARVKNVKKMLYMGQSQMLVPSHHHYRQSQYQSQNHSRSYSNTLTALSDSYILTGSEFLQLKSKPYLTGYESWRAEKELKMALETDMFKIQPAKDEEDNEKAGDKTTKNKDKSKDSSKTKAKEDVKSSTVLQNSCKKIQRQTGSPVLQGEYRKIHTEEAKGKEKQPTALPKGPTSKRLRSREELECEWKAKEDRDITGRAKITNNYEDVMEMEALRSMDGFKPSLLGVVLEDYQRGQSTDEESEEEDSNTARRNQQERVTRRGYGEKEIET
ncbi:hypothetical protein ONS95_004354 [Cadophora gregata]|uniref:uncharacterized protein n=1 Tax=Cadophora gregata TaxID=51156 RepID=UPI0026DC0CA9|nr:uncharacterized protein ONS95_004354 [Cadophora gregata]KAK0105258.1 hypothetical protein ONS96_004655 [Cadophora gregata f. sp. sojae]KAK0105839.1 hypothetical protein ONS95_004354 [Cadophora gregata]